MNKVFKKVFNAARGMMMVVNETTSSVQTGKKAAVTVAVATAFACGAGVVNANPADIVLSGDTVLELATAENSPEYAAIVGSTSHKANNAFNAYDYVLEKVGDQTTLVLTGSSSVDYKDFLHVDLNGHDVVYNGHVGDEGRAESVQRPAMGNLPALINPGSSGLFIHDESDGEKGSVTINGGLSGTGSIDVKNLIVSTDDARAFHVNGTDIKVPNKVMAVQADTVSLTGINEVVRVYQAGATFGAEKAIEQMTIDARNGTRPIYVQGDGAYVKIFADELDIYGTKDDEAKAIRVSHGSELVIEAQSGVLDTSIQAGYKGDVSVGVASVNVTLGAGAEFNGSFITKDDGDSALTLNGAKWNVEKNSQVDSLTLGGGIVNLKDGVTVDVGELAGSGVVNVATTDGATSAALQAAEATEGAALKVNIMDADLENKLNADQISVDGVKAVMANIGGEGVAATTEVGEGMYNGAISVAADGMVIAATNSVMSNSLDLATSAPLAVNRLLMNDVRKRLGNIRSAEGSHGVWARYDGGRLSGAMGLENDFHTLQFGIDTVPAADAPRFGVAFSYTQSDADMKRGGAEMDAFGLAVYATKMYDNGAFVDVIGRIATANSDLIVDGDKKGSMDNLAVSLSAEAGWRFNMTERHYVEPQVEVTYTRVNNSDLALSNGASYGFDNVDSVIGRAGFAAGFTCPDNKGDVYVRASVVREFMGDAAVRGGNAVHALDGADTWFEYGIGANFNLNKNTYVYADVERTSGGALDEDWRANVGVRFSF